VITGRLVSTLGDWLCAGTNFFLGVWLEAAGPSQVELVVLDWFRTLLGCPPTTAGLLTGGGSEANLTALLAARERLTDDQRRDAVVYTSELRHWSVDRAVKIIGLRPHQVRRLPPPTPCLSPPGTESRFLPSIFLPSLRDAARRDVLESPRRWVPAGVEVLGCIPEWCAVSRPSSSLVSASAGRRCSRNLRAKRRRPTSRRPIRRPPECAVTRGSPGS